MWALYENIQLFIKLLQSRNSSIKLDRIRVLLKSHELLHSQIFPQWYLSFEDKNNYQIITSSTTVFGSVSRYEACKFKLLQSPGNATAVKNSRRANKHTHIEITATKTVFKISFLCVFVLKTYVTSACSCRGLLITETQ